MYICYSDKILKFVRTGPKQFPVSWHLATFFTLITSTRASRNSTSPSGSRRSSTPSRTFTTSSTLQKSPRPVTMANCHEKLVPTTSWKSRLICSLLAALSPLSSMSSRLTRTVSCLPLLQCALFWCAPLVCSSSVLLQCAPLVPPYAACASLFDHADRAASRSRYTP